MPDTVTIKLYGGSPPSMVKYVVWVLVGNLAVFGALALLMGLVWFFGGGAPQISLGGMIAIGVIASAVAIGIAAYLGWKHLRSAMNTPSASLSVSPDEIAIRGEERTHLEGSRDQLQPRLKHFYENVQGQDYYVGPALQLTLAQDAVVLARLDGSVRWESDPPSVTEADFICHEEGWDQLLETFDLEDVVVPYRRE